MQSGNLFQNRAGIYALIALAILICGVSVFTAMLSTGDKGNSDKIAAVPAPKTSEPGAQTPPVAPLSQDPDKASLVDSQTEQTEVPAQEVTRIAPEKKSSRSPKRIAYRSSSPRHVHLPPIDGLPAGGEFGPPAASRAGGAHNVEEWMGDKRRFIMVPQQ